MYRERGKFCCNTCGKIYKWYSGLYRHRTYECGKAPRFQCPHCDYVAKQRPHVYTHIKSAHKNSVVYALDLERS
jgi:KRAB domain-containing zinc finger protein